MNNFKLYVMNQWIIFAWTAQPLQTSLQLPVSLRERAFSWWFFLGAAVPSQSYCLPYATYMRYTQAVKGIGCRRVTCHLLFCQQCEPYSKLVKNWTIYLVFKHHFPCSLLLDHFSSTAGT